MNSVVKILCVLRTMDSPPNHMVSMIVLTVMFAVAVRL